MRNAFSCWLLALLLIPSTIATAAPGKSIDNPDFTQGDPIPENAEHTWNLGATGLRGWMYTNQFDTTEARQIKVTEVMEGSPADGIIEVGDVILGVGGEPFAYDPRTEVGKALTACEAEDGKLEVLRWRDGETESVTLQLQVLGSYSDTAPYDCPKSAEIYKRGCEWLAKELQQPDYKPNAIVRSLNALALLASGDDQYSDLLKQEAKWISEFSTGGFQTWYYGYCIIYLSEYVMITGDESVRPGLDRLVSESVNGQSAVGSWGHGFAGPDGRLLGYGMMNAPGLVLTNSLVIARTAGVEVDGLDSAIEKSANLLRFYVGKGSIPYGDHDPWIQTHDDNGKNGCAALLFNQLDEPEAVEYFSRMSVATHGAERDTGHTGNFWNMLWAQPAVAQSGPNATGAWMAEFGWYYDLARRFDGSFAHLGPPQARPDSTDKWDCTGLYLLAYAMPRNTLRLTSREHFTAPQISAEEAASLIEDGRGWSNRDRLGYYFAMSDEELLGRLRNWSPVVRERAAQALSKKQADVVSQLIEMVGNDDLYTRDGACRALRYQRGVGQEAVDALIEAFNGDDLWIRILAAQALAGIGESARSVAPLMLERITQHDVENDPRNMEQRYLTTALFGGRGGLLGSSLEGIDRELLYRAVRAGLQNQDGRSRGTISSVYDNLTFEELKPLLPAIHEAIKVPSPSGIMFADQIRVAGLELFSKHRVEEGMELIAHYAQYQKAHGSQKRIEPVLALLDTYGAHAQRVIPQLEDAADYFEHRETNFPKRMSLDKARITREAIERIKAAEQRPELISLPESED